MSETIRVLMLEDNPGDARLNEEYLVDAGYAPETCRVETESEFLSKLAEFRPEVVLADYRLPRFDGFTALRLVQEHHPFVPFIIVSGALEEESAVELLKSGAADYILKDKLTRLGSAVKNALGIKQAREEKARAEEALRESYQELERRVEERTRELARLNEELRRNEYELRTLVDNSPDLIFRVDRDLRYVYVNPSYERVTGILKEQFEGKTNHELGMLDEHSRIIDEAIRKVVRSGSETSLEFYFNTLFGTRWFGGRVIPEFDRIGMVETVIILLRDITEQKRAEEHIRHISFHDTITGLFNRAYFEEEMRRLDSGRMLPVSIIMIDLHNLKLTSDLFGHAEGDALLMSMGDILRGCCRDEDIIARWGGHEFVIMLPGIDRDAAEEIRERLRQGAAESRRTAIHPTIALGAATKTSKDENLMEVLRQAEFRMYENKITLNPDREGFINLLLTHAGEAIPDLREHIERSHSLGRKLGQALALSGEAMDALHLLIDLHDIGQAAVPREILTKPGELTPMEWEIIKKHPVTGFRIAKSFAETARISNEILSHGERWDGSGYPRGLKGLKIPFLARVFAVINAYDVMTHDRAYREAVAPEKAIEELRRNAGRQFDPELTEIFIRNVLEAETDLNHQHPIH